MKKILADYSNEILKINKLDNASTSRLAKEAATVIVDRINKNDQENLQRGKKRRCKRKKEGMSSAAKTTSVTSPSVTPGPTRPSTTASSGETSATTSVAATSTVVSMTTASSSSPSSISKAAPQNQKVCFNI